MRAEGTAATSGPDVLNGGPPQRIVVIDVWQSLQVSFRTLSARACTALSSGLRQRPKAHAHMLLQYHAYAIARRPEV
jgi:hypothetical protein